MRLFISIILVLFSHWLYAAPILVDTEWLAKHKHDKNVVVVDMTADNLQYSRFHIPGAVRLSYSDIVIRRRDKVSARLPDGQLEKVLGALGITADTHVVMYDDLGSMEAGRLFWELERIGHTNMSVVDGGLVQWVLEGRKVDNIPVKPKPAVYTASGKGRDNEADFSHIREVVENGSATLLDVRTRDEYVGHPRAPRSGHIPGARWLGWDTNVDFAQGFKLKSDKTLLENLKTVGVSDKKAPVVLYCRSGHRASQSYLTLRKLGYEDVRLYDASMAEYERNKAAPLVKGLSPK